MSGPLSTVRVIEFAGLGPAPLAGQLLADMGAEVIVIDRVSGDSDPTDINRRAKQSIALNLKSKDGLGIARDLIATADILIEGFRPGVMERLGLGPGDCPETLIYGRMTGWGQTGPLAQTAGHDINYLALTGALHAMGPKDAPPPVPLNLVGDYGGGTMFLLFGLLTALIERATTGKGAVIDAAMTDGVPAMMGLVHSMLARGTWVDQRQSNWLDGAAPFYRCYECADGRFIAVGALEPQFYAELITRAGLDDTCLQDQNNQSLWAQRTLDFAAHFLTKSRDAWAQIFEGSDACVTPVLTFAEAAEHPHNKDRATFVSVNGILQAHPAPRSSRHEVAVLNPPSAPGAQTTNILSDLGYTAQEIAQMKTAGALT